MRERTAASCTTLAARNLHICIPKTTVVARYELNDTELKLLAETFVKRTGLRFDKAKRPLLERALPVRLKAAGAKNVAEYCQFLISGHSRAEAEVKELVQTLAVKETHFFRNEPQWRALQEHVLPGLLRSSSAQRRALRVWSAGCSTGEEPYTLALILREHFRSAKVEFHATDIDESALETAAQGRYGTRSVRKMVRGYLDRYFQVSGNRYVLSKSIREMVDFSCLNLADRDFPSNGPSLRNLDLILCRNVIIYFPEELCYQVLARFSQCLLTGGYLVLGHAETQYRNPDFQIERYGNAFFYRRIGVEAGCA